MTYTTSAKGKNAAFRQPSRFHWVGSVGSAGNDGFGDIFIAFCAASAGEFK
ncbi:MAG: hypothetical protein AAGC95_00025 [Pseudomonadota bacterium]